jgi:hypothetical protein
MLAVFRAVVQFWDVRPHHLAMPYSNIFDAMRKLIIALLSIIASTPILCFVFDKPNEPVGWMFFWLTCFFGLFWFIAWLLARWVLTNTFHSFIYISFSLFTPVTLREARELAPLFSLGADRKWYPCREVLELPRNERKAVLYATLERYQKGGV